MPCLTHHVVKAKDYKEHPLFLYVALQVRIFLKLL